MISTYYTTLQELETIRDTKGNPYWNIDAASADYLQACIRTNGYQRALELGTSNGLSALYLAAALADTHGTLVTVESHAERFTLATKHFEAAHVTHIVSQVRGHAPEVLDTIPGMFDFLFIDATSVEYALYYRELKSRITPGGMIVTDNILSHTEKVQDFIDAVQQDIDMSVSLEPIGKGLLVARRNT